MQLPCVKKQWSLHWLFPGTLVRSWSVKPVRKPSVQAFQTESCGQASDVQRPDSSGCSRDHWQIDEGEQVFRKRKNLAPCVIFSWRTSRSPTYWCKCVVAQILKPWQHLPSAFNHKRQKMIPSSNWITINRIATRILTTKFCHPNKPHYHQWNKIESSPGEILCVSSSPDLHMTPPGNDVLISWCRGFKSVQCQTNVMFRPSKVHQILIHFTLGGPLRRHGNLPCFLTHHNISALGFSGAWLLYIPVKWLVHGDPH